MKNLEIKGFIAILIVATIGIAIGKLLDRLLAAFIKSYREDLYEKLHDKTEDNLDHMYKIELELVELNQMLDDLVDMKEYHPNKRIILTQKQLELLDNQIRHMEEYAIALKDSIREEQIMVERERALGKRIFKEKI